MANVVNHANGGVSRGQRRLFRSLAEPGRCQMNLGSRRLSLPVIALVAVVSACGSDGRRADEAQARAVFQQYLSALARPDYREACSLMTRSQQKIWADLGHGLVRKRRNKVTRHLRALLLSGCAGTHQVIYGGAGLSPRARRRKLAGERRTIENAKIGSVRISGNRAFLETKLPRPKATLKKVNGLWRLDAAG